MCDIGWILFSAAAADMNSQLSTMNPQPTPGSKLGIDATKKLPGEGFKRPWPPLIKMDKATRKKIDSLFKTHPQQPT